MENDFNKLFNDSILSINSAENIKNSLEIIKHIQDVIKKNENLIIEANDIDIKNNNGYKIDFQIIEAIFKELLEEQPLIEVKELMKINKDNLIFSKMYTNKGLISVIFEGDTYLLLSIVLKGILTHNSILLSQYKFLYGTNNLIVHLIQNVLEQSNYNPNIVQLNITSNFELLLNNFLNVNLSIIVGNREFQNKFLKLCSTNTLCSGYMNYDIYIDDSSYISFVKKLLNTNANIKIYVNEKINESFSDSIIVSDVDEAIFQIKCNGSNYGTAIFTSDSKNASLFVSQINFSNVFVNASPLLEKSLDISQHNLLNEKLIVLPFPYKIEEKDD